MSCPNFQRVAEYAKAVVGPGGLGNAMQKFPDVYNHVRTCTKCQGIVGDTVQQAVNWDNVHKRLRDNLDQLNNG